MWLIAFYSMCRGRVDALRLSTLRLLGSDYLVQEMSMVYARFGFALLLVFGLFPVQASAAPALAYTEIKVQIARVQIADGVSFDDAVDSLKLRANQHNLKFVGASPLHKEVEALTGKPAKRMEIFSFCDGLTAQQMIAEDPLMIAFMPCRIALVEDKQGARWLVSMMMSEAMIAAMPAAVRGNAQRIMAAMKDAMLAASNGDI